MALVADLMRIDDQRRAAAPAEAAMRRPPDGSIEVDGRRMAVWLPPGETPFTLRLDTFKRRPT